MPPVASGAGPLGAVGVDAAYPAVGPGGGVKFAIAFVDDGRPMALLTPIGCRSASLDNLTEHVVQRADEARRLGMMRCFKFLDFARVAPIAVIRRDYDRNLIAIVVKGRRISIIRPVTGVAIYALLVVGAAFPLLDNPRCGVLMTGQTTFSFG